MTRLGPWLAQSTRLRHIVWDINRAKFLIVEYFIILELRIGSVINRSPLLSSFLGLLAARLSALDPGTVSSCSPIKLPPLPASNRRTGDFCLKTTIMVAHFSSDLCFNAVVFSNLPLNHIAIHNEASTTNLIKCDTLKINAVLDNSLSIPILLLSDMKIVIMHYLLSSYPSPSVSPSTHSLSQQTCVDSQNVHSSLLSISLAKWA